MSLSPILGLGILRIWVNEPKSGLRLSTIPKDLRAVYVDAFLVEREQLSATIS